jgi:hypothetical protein
MSKHVNTCMDDLSTCPFLMAARSKTSLVLSKCSFRYLYLRLFRLIGGPSGNLISRLTSSPNLNSKSTSILKSRRRPKCLSWADRPRPIACRLACNGLQISVTTRLRPQT